MRLILLSLVLTLSACASYPGPYDYDDPYYQSSTAYNGPYDDRYYDPDDSVGYSGGYVGAYDVTHRYDPWFALYWGWDYYGYAPYRHNYYNSYYGYGHVPFYRPYYGYGWSAWDYLWWPSSGYYGYGYHSRPYYGGWYGSGYYWHPRAHRRDDHRSARQAAREVRAGVPATYSSRPDARSRNYGGQSYGNRGYGVQSYGSRGYGGQSQGNPSFGNPSGRYPPQRPGSVRDAVRDAAPQNGSGQTPRSSSQPASRPAAGAASRPPARGRSSSDAPMSSYPATNRGRQSVPPAQPARVYLRDGGDSQRGYPAETRRSAPAASPGYQAPARPAANAYRPASPASAAPSSAPSRASAPASGASAPATRSTAPAASSGSSRPAGRGRNEQND